MNSTLENHPEIQNKNLQRFYSIYSTVGFIFSGILITLWLLAVFSIIRLEIGIVVLKTVILFAIFAALSSFIRFRDKNHILKAPSFISEKSLKFISRGALVFFVLVFGYGMLVYPYAPIKQDGSVFTDKAGQEYSYTEFMTFKKWELTLASSWGFALLQAAVSMPVLYVPSKRWWKF